MNLFIKLLAKCKFIFYIEHSDILVNTGGVVHVNKGSET